MNSEGKVDLKKDSKDNIQDVNDVPTPGIEKDSIYYLLFIYLLLFIYYLFIYLLYYGYYHINFHIFFYLYPIDIFSFIPFHIFSH
jgi:hypothetical protein